jgi:chromosome segregation ATPase
MSYIVFGTPEEVIEILQLKLQHAETERDTARAESERRFEELEEQINRRVQEEKERDEALRASEAEIALHSDSLEHVNELLWKLHDAEELGRRAKDSKILAERCRDKAEKALAESRAEIGKLHERISWLLEAGRKSSGWFLNPDVGVPYFEALNTQECDELSAERDEARQDLEDARVALRNLTTERNAHAEKARQAEKEISEYRQVNTKLHNSLSRERLTVSELFQRFGRTHENQETINDWARETFGSVTPLKAFCRARKEWRELEDLMTENMSSKAVEESADVVITLYRMASCFGLDLHEAVDRKMAINRSREWVLNSDGTGQHKEGS